MSISTPTYGSDDERRARRSEMTKALARGGMDGVHVITLEQAEAVLTPKRQELIEALAHGEYESVRQLARHLGRDKAQVSRDLSVLAKNAIVSYDTDGRSKSPRLTQEHIIVEPIV